MTKTVDPSAKIVKLQVEVIRYDFDGIGASAGYRYIRLEQILVSLQVPWFNHVPRTHQDLNYLPFSSQFSSQALNRLKWPCHTLATVTNSPTKPSLRSCQISLKRDF